MIALEVHLNGKELCIAGADGGGVVNAMVCWAGGNRPGATRKDDSLDFRVGGLLNRLNEHVEWARGDLRVGDTVAVTIIETGKVRLPPKRNRKSAVPTKRRQKARLRQMAKALGWRIQTGTGKRG